MAGGSGAAVADDIRVKPGEKIWRLIPKHWYQPNSSGRPEVIEAAFLDEVSVLRASIGLIDLGVVDAAKGGKFKGWGVVELDSTDIRSAGCIFEVHDEPEWPSESHAILRRDTGGKNLRATHSQVPKLLKLANQGSLVRTPA
jgi:hypothetical protein